MEIEIKGFVFFGGVAGAAIGGLDAQLGAVSLDTISLVPLLFYTAALTALPGALLGWALGFALRAINPKSMLERLRSPLPLALIIVAGALSIWLFVKLLHHRGIQMDAVRLTAPMLFLSGFVATVLCPFFFRLKPRHLTLAITILIAFAAGILFLGAFRIHRSSGVIETIETKTRFAKIPFRLMRRSFDSDGDGFPRFICETDCDCDDTHPRIHPAALEVPNNGIDEDCRSGDLQGTATVKVARADLSPELPTPMNIILISVDAMRADHLHSYGYHRVTTPNIDELARTHVRFTQVRSQGPSTRHAFPPLLTGRYFSSLDLIKGKKWSKLLASNTTFAERLKEKNYATKALLPYFRFKEHSGFQQGFDSWETTLGGDRHPVWDRTGDLVTNAGLAHLSSLQNSKDPWFLWLHYFDPHASYVRHPDQPSFGQDKVDLYDGELLFVDREIGRFVARVKGMGLWKSTAVIIISDHGEGLGLPGDHGQSYHGFTLYDTEIRVPLIVKIPGVDAGEVTQSVALMDVAPTIAELAGFERDESLHGHSLIPFILGDSQSRGPFLTELPGDAPLIGVVDWPFKLIWNIRPNRFELYNLESDENEMTNIADQNPNIVKKMRDALSNERQRP